MNYYEKPCRALLKLKSGKTRSIKSDYQKQGHKYKSGAVLIGLWSESTGKSLI